MRSFMSALVGMTARFSLVKSLVPGLRGAGITMRPRDGGALGPRHDPRPALPPVGDVPLARHDGAGDRPGGVPRHLGQTAAARVSTTRPELLPDDAPAGRVQVHAGV